MECYLVKKVCSKLPGSGKITTLCACMAAKPRHTTMCTHRIEKLVLFLLVLSIVENNHANVSIIDGVANKLSYKFCYKRHISAAFNGIASPQKIAVRRPSNPHLRSSPRQLNTPCHRPATPLFHIFHPTPPQKKG